MAEEIVPAEGGGKRKIVSTKLLIIIAAVAVLLAGAGGAAWFFLSADSATEGDLAKEKVIRQEALYVKLRTQSGKPSFIANLVEKNGRQRYLQIYAEAMTRDQSVADALTKHMPLVVHELSTLYSSQVFTDLQTAEGKERLRKQSGQKVQALLRREIKRSGVEEVFFTNFVMQ